MKKLLFLFLFVSLLSGCNIISKPGNLEITVSYFYNNFQGYKPDVGAEAYLINKKYTDSLCMDSINLITSRSGVFYNKFVKDEFYDPKGMLKSEADLNGKINFKDLPVGDYFILLVSHGRYVYSKKELKIESTKTLSLVKNFEYLHDMDQKGESWN